MEKNIIKTTTKNDADRVVGRFLFGAVVTLALLALLGLLPGGANAQGLYDMGSAKQSRTFGALEVPSQQGRQPLPVRGGLVLDVTAVQIEVAPASSDRVFGGIIGAALGTVAARNGSYSAKALAGAIGAFAGDKIATNASSEMRKAMQVVVKLTTGEIIAIVQEENGAPLAVGNLVYVIGQGVATRAIRANSNQFVDGYSSPSIQP